MDELSQAAQSVLKERKRQIEKEGWTAEHDDDHRLGELAQAGACYAAHAGLGIAINMLQLLRAQDPPGYSRLMRLQSYVHEGWPWSKEWWKPSLDHRRNLVKAAALILAEIERLDRA